MSFFFYPPRGLAPVHDTRMQKKETPFPGSWKMSQVEAQAEALSNGQNVYFVAVPLMEEYPMGTREEEKEYFAVFLQYPPAHVMRIITPMLAQQKLYEVAEIVLENCTIDGDREAFSTPEMVFSSVPAIEKMLASRMGKMGKRWRPGGTQ